MAFQRIADAVLEINNDVVEYVGSTLKIHTGQPEIKVDAQTAGNGNTSTVHGIDSTTSVGKTMVDLTTTPENVAIARQLKNNVGTNSIRVTSPNFVGSSVSNSVVNDYEIATGTDGVISLEFHGDPFV